MGRKLACALLAACLVCGLLGCGGIRTTQSFTYAVETGDRVTVTLDNLDGYELSSGLPFCVSQDGAILTQGQFVTRETCEQLVGAVEEDPGAVILDAGTKDGNTYIFWSFDDTEFNYAILLGDSDTGLILANNISRESAETCFAQLTISLEE